MKNDFFKISSKRILFSMMMASALLAGSPQAIFAGVNEIQAVMQTGTVKGQVVDVQGEPIYNWCQCFGERYYEWNYYGF